MAVTTVLSSGAEMIAMAGENVDATGFTDANNTAWGIQAEGYLSALMAYDLVTNVATLNAIGKSIFSEYVARYVGASAIAYNMAGFTSRVEAEDMLNFHYARMLAIEKVLNEGGIQVFLKKV